MAKDKTEVSNAEKQLTRDSPWLTKQFVFGLGV